MADGFAPLPSRKRRGKRDDRRRAREEEEEFFLPPLRSPLQDQMDLGVAALFDPSIEPMPPMPLEDMGQMPRSRLDVIARGALHDPWLAERYAPRSDDERRREDHENDFAGVPLSPPIDAVPETRGSNWRRRREGWRAEGAESLRALREGGWDRPQGALGRGVDRTGALIAQQDPVDAARNVAEFAVSPITFPLIMMGEGEDLMRAAEREPDWRAADALAAQGLTAQGGGALAAASNVLPNPVLTGALRARAFARGPEQIARVGEDAAQGIGTATRVGQPEVAQMERAMGRLARANDETQGVVESEAARAFREEESRRRRMIANARDFDDRRDGAPMRGRDQGEGNDLDGWMTERRGMLPELVENQRDIDALNSNFGAQPMTMNRILRDAQTGDLDVEIARRLGPLGAEGADRNVPLLSVGGGALAGGLTGAALVPQDAEAGDGGDGEFPWASALLASGGALAGGLIGRGRGSRPRRQTSAEDRSNPGAVRYLEAFRLRRAREARTAALEALARTTPPTPALSPTARATQRWEPPFFRNPTRYPQPGASNVPRLPDDPLASVAGGALVGGAGGALLAPTDAEAGDGGEHGALWGPVAGGLIGAAFGARRGGRHGRGGARNRSVLTEAESAAARSADEAGTLANSSAQLPLAGEYSRGATSRVLAEAERIARENGGRLPVGYKDMIAERTGYEPSSVAVMMHNLRRGNSQNVRYEDDIIARARMVGEAQRGPRDGWSEIRRFLDARERAGPEVTDRELIEALGINGGSVRARLSVLRNPERYPQYKPPEELRERVRNMAGGRRRGRPVGGGSSSALAPLALAGGAGALAVGGGEAEAQADEGGQLEFARSRVTQLEEALAALDNASANASDPEAVMAAQRVLNVRVDGNWGGETRAAAERRRAEIQTELAAARGRRDELERNAAYAATRPDEGTERFRDWAPVLSTFGGALLAEYAPFGFGRLSAVRSARRGVEARNARANALLNAEPLPPVTRNTGVAARAAANQEAAARRGNVDQFWSDGGAGGRVPFRDANTELGYQPRAQADVADAGALYPPEGSIPPGSGLYRGNDFVHAALGGADAAVGWTLLQGAREEEEAAQAAVDANPTQANLQRLEEARAAVTRFEAMMQAGIGYGGGRLGAPFLHRYPDERPNLDVARGERTRLNQYWASDAWRSPPPRRRSQPKK